MKKLLIFTLAVLAFACSNPKKEEAEKLKKETFALHDEVMPLTMKVVDLKDKLDGIATTDAVLKEKIMNAKTIITKADDQMNSWMERLGEADKISDVDAKIAKLNELKAEGERIKALTNQAKQNAEELLK